MMSMSAPPIQLPTLTEVLIPGQTPPANTAVPVQASTALDLQTLEAQLLAQLVVRIQATLEQRVHASVAPAVSLLADRIASKAAQEWRRAWRSACVRTFRSRLRRLCRRP